MKASQYGTAAYMLLVFSFGVMSLVMDIDRPFTEPGTWDRFGHVVWLIVDAAMIGGGLFGLIRLAVTVGGSERVNSGDAS